MRRQITVILHTFSPFRHSCVRWHVETNVFCAFCHPEAAGPMTCGEPFGPAIFHLLSSRGGGSDDMRRQIMVISHTFSPFRHSRVRWHAETNVVFCIFCHAEAAGSMTCGDKFWSFRTPFRHSDTVVSDGTQRLTSSSAPFVIQRWRAR